MLVTKQAIGAKLIGDATLTTLLGGQYVYQQAPDIAGLSKWITYWCVAESVDPETGMVSESYQIDVWTEDPDDGDAIAERVETVMVWRPGVSGSGVLTVSGRRQAMPVTAEPVSPDLIEPADAGTLHHKVRQIRVATYAA